MPPEISDRFKIANIREKVNGALKPDENFDMIKRKNGGEAVSTKEGYIAVFDSGLGGISVLRHLIRTMPGERYLYFGDSANAPYGSRPTSEVRDLTLAAAEKLMAQKPLKALVLACNTATSAAVQDLRQRYPDLIVIGIEPALKLAADRYPGGRIGVMATEVTLREEKFNTLLQRFRENGTITKIPMPGLVQLVEAGKTDSEEMEELLRTLLAPHIGNLDAVVLGCTHYPLAAKAISKVLGEEVALLDGGEGTARETRRRLANAGLLEEGCGELIMENSGSDPGLLERGYGLLRQERE